MSTAQPAPVTPPPEWVVNVLWKVSGYRPLSVIARDAAESTYAKGDDQFPIIEWFPTVDLARAAVLKHNAEIVERARNAPPPAPSCPTEQGELAALIERVEQVMDKWSDDLPVELIDSIGKLFAALSRQPAPSGIAEHRWEELVRDLHAQIDENGVHGQTDGSIQAKINAVCKERDDHKARIASLEAELAIFRENNGNLIQQVEELQRTLRAAPSAVAKDRAEVVERLHYTLQFVAREMSEEHAKTVNDAISLLSQPAVAQTEAGNDMTLSEFVRDLSTHGLRFDLNPTHNLRDPETFWHLYFKRADDSIKERATSALSESSPKSPSVPAVAGGGEGVEPERVKTARKTVAELNNTSHECFEALGIISDYEKDACIASLEEEVAQLRFLTTTENGEALVISDLTEEVRDLRAAARPVDSVYADLLAKDRDVETLLAQDNEITRKEKEQALNRLLCAAQAARPADSALVDRLVKATKAFQNTVRSWIPATTHSMARIAKIQSAELLDVLEEYDAAQAPRPAEPKS